MYIGLETGLGLETDFLQSWSWSQTWARGLDLHLVRYWSRSFKVGLKTEHFLDFDGDVQCNNRLEVTLSLELGSPALIFILRVPFSGY